MRHSSASLLPLVSLPRKCSLASWPCLYVQGLILSEHCHLQDGIPRQLTLVGQKPREAMERLSLMQFARVRLRETASQPAEEALGRLPLAKTRVWRPDHDRALLMVRENFPAVLPMCCCSCLLVYCADSQSKKKEGQVR